MKVATPRLHTKSGIYTYAVGVSFSACFVFFNVCAKTRLQGLQLLFIAKFSITYRKLCDVSLKSATQISREFIRYEQKNGNFYRLLRPLKYTFPHLSIRKPFWRYGSLLGKFGFGVVIKPCRCVLT